MPLAPSNILLSGIGLHGFLSFEASSFIGLKPLNVIIGPNASGKSNFIHGVSWLKSWMTDIPEFIRTMGGKDRLVNQRSKNKSGASLTFNLKSKFSDYQFESQLDLLFDVDPNLPTYIGEQIVAYKETKEDGVPVVVRRGRTGMFRPTRRVNLQDGKQTYMNASFAIGKDDDLYRFEVDLESAQSKSSLEIIKNPDQYAAQQYIFNQCKSIWISQLHNTRSLTSIRRGQDADLRKDALFEDFSNVGLWLNRIENSFELKERLVEFLTRINPLFKGLHLEIQANTVYIHMYESGMKNSIPASRLSDGTLLFLCLAALLLDPDPPPLICLEEPEVGLHPGVIHLVAELLLDASQRTQIIVTTHSDILVDAIGRHDPGAIMICDKDEEGTKITCPDPEQLAAWLEKYTLGELWLSGELGGTP